MSSRKYRELLETPVSRTISSQATQECVEGSTTRSWSPERTVKAHERGTPFKGDDIVWPAWQHAEVSHKQAYDNKSDDVIPNWTKQTTSSYGQTWSTIQ